MVYVISDNDGYIKIGSTNNLDARIKQLQCGNARPLSVVRCYHTTRDAYLENYLHKYLSKYRVNVSVLQTSEWFSEEALLLLDSVSDEQIANLTFGTCRSEGRYAGIDNKEANQSFLQEKVKRLSSQLSRRNTELRNIRSDNSDLRKRINLLENEVSGLRKHECPYLLFGERPDCEVYRKEAR